LRVTLSNDFAENGEESPVRAINPPPKKVNGLAEKASPLGVAPRDDVADVSQSWLGLALTGLGPLVRTALGASAPLATRIVR